MPGLKDRAKTLVELADGATFLFAERPLEIEKAKALLMGNQDVLRDALAAPEGRRGRVERRLHGSEDQGFRRRKGLKLGAVAQPLRAALTGRTTLARRVRRARGLAGTKSLARIGDQID